MTTIVPRNPAVSLLHDPHREIDERAEPTALAMRRLPPTHIAPPATPKAAETHVTQLQPPPTEGFFDSVVRQVLGAAPPTRGYSSVSPTVRLPATRTVAPAIGAPQSATRSTKATSAATSRASSSSSRSTGSSSTTTARELAFLNDKNLSIEEKLFRFISLMTKKGDQELIDAMKSYETRRAASTSSSSPSSTSSPSNASSTDTTPPAAQPSGGGGGGFFGLIGNVFGGAVDAVSSVVKEVGGPLLGAAATAVGLPMLAPVASMAGGALAGLVADQTLGRLKPGSSSKSSGTRTASGSSGKTATSSSSTSSARSSSSTSATSGDFDEKLEMMNLQRLVEKQSAMFTALSNVMKSIHEAQMSAVQNIR